MNTTNETAESGAQREHDAQTVSDAAVARNVDGKSLHDARQELRAARQLEVEQVCRQAAGHRAVAAALDKTAWVAFWVFRALGSVFCGLAGAAIGGFMGATLTGIIQGFASLPKQKVDELEASAVELPPG